MADETSAWDLLNVLNSTATSNCRLLPGYEPCSGLDRTSLGLDDEVFKNIFIGNGCTAMDKGYMQCLGVTHVLNASEGNGVAMVNTNSEYYSDCNVLYMGIPAHDDPSFNICNYFEAASEFISTGIQSGGKVFVHCWKGTSRSSTIVAAYLMMRLGVPGPLALRMCRAKRPIMPNGGFLVQLADLHNHLRGLASKKYFYVICFILWCFMLGFTQS